MQIESKFITNNPEPGKDSGTTKDSPKQDREALFKEAVRESRKIIDELLNELPECAHIPTSNEKGRTICINCGRFLD